MDVPDGIPSREDAPGRCRRCGRPLVLREPAHAVEYFVCPEPHDPPVVIQAPRDVRYAFATVGPNSLLFGSEYVWEDFGDWDGTTVDPARILEKFCERIATTHEADRERERERRQEQREAVAGVDADATANDSDQSGLERWS